MQRRFVLAATTGLIPVLLGGCGIFSSTTTDNRATVTVDVGRLNTWGQAWASGAKFFAGLPGIIGTPAAALINGISTAIMADLAALAATTGGTQKLTFDATSIPAAVNSLLSDGETLLADAQATLAGVAQTSVNIAMSYINGIQTLVSLFQAEIGTQTAVSAMKGLPMTEAKAVAVLMGRA